MEYITTFDNVFIFLSLLLTAGLITLFVFGCLTKTPESQQKMNQITHDYRYYIHGFWIIMLLVAGVNSLEGTTTFLAVCFVIGFIAAGVMRKKMQHNPLGYQMVDLSGFIREELNGKMPK